MQYACAAQVETPPTGHAVRLIFQSVLLAMFYEMANPTLVDFKANTGIDLLM